VQAPDNTPESTPCINFRGWAPACRSASSTATRSREKTEPGQDLLPPVSGSQGRRRVTGSALGANIPEGSFPVQAPDNAPESTPCINFRVRAPTCRFETATSSHEMTEHAQYLLPTVSGNQGRRRVAGSALGANIPEGSYPVQAPDNAPESTPCINVRVWSPTCRSATATRSREPFEPAQVFCAGAGQPGPTESRGFGSGRKYSRGVLSGASTG